MNHHIKALILVVVILSASGCMLSPYDGQRVSSRTSTVRFNGYDVVANTVTTIRAYNFGTGAWDAVGSATSGSGGLALFTGTTQQFYPWSTSFVLPSAYWAPAPSGAGYYARVRAGGGFNHYAVRADWASCWTENQGDINAWMRECPTHRNPEAYVYTFDYQHGGAGCSQVPSTVKSRYSVTEISSACQRQAVSDLIASYVDRVIVDGHYQIDHMVAEDFFFAHRAYLGRMELYLSVYGSQWMPSGRLPFWDPTTTIPAELRQVKASPQECRSSREASCNVGWNDDPISGFNPNLPKPANLAPGAVCGFGSLESLHHATHPWHDRVHPAVGGTMATFDSPAAVIFWPWHTYVDQILTDWQACPR